MPIDQGQRILHSLASDVLSSSTTSLTHAERLWIVHHSGLLESLNVRWLNDLFMQTGCYSQAENVYQRLGHRRKLGDLAFAAGDHQKAKELYRFPEDRAGEIFRSGEDWDRLILLHFILSDWQELITVLLEANIEPLGEAQVILGSSARSKRPLVRMASIAQARAGRDGDEQLSDRLSRRMGVSSSEWRILLQTQGRIPDKELEKKQTSAYPFRKWPAARNLEDALMEGQTGRSCELLDAMKSFADNSHGLKQDLESFLVDGDPAKSGRVLALLLALRVPDLVNTALFYLDNKGHTPGATAHRLAFYCSHPLILRFRLGHVVSLKSLEGLSLDGGDLLSGVFQTLAWPTREFEKRIKRSEIDLLKFQSCREWAELKLSEWATGDGSALLVEAQQKLRLLGYQDVRREACWLNIMETLIQWLSLHWKQEIGVSPWISENQLFQLLKRSFKPREIVQHDSPLWLGNQHLDVHIPSLKLAVEYQGQQHYGPVAIFGGESGYERTIERDRRKARLCAEAEVTLEYVRFDEEIDARVRDITERHR
ncbi:MAG TPA: hypothetical protein EYF98_16400 [Planctomycetes bacterium]|nr:hypothetical protein [Planctomycetota bacterium]